MGERLDKFPGFPGPGHPQGGGGSSSAPGRCWSTAPPSGTPRQSRARRRPGDSPGGGNLLPGIPHHHAEQAGGESSPPQRTAARKPCWTCSRRACAAGGFFPAGRLDKDTTGLLLITDDGELAHKMLSPKSHVYKQYRAQLDAPVEEADIQALCRWRRLGGGAVRPRPPVGGAGPPSRLCGDPGGPFPPGQADVPGRGKTVLQLKDSR